MPNQNQDYVCSRIEHALDEADGNPAKAQRLLVSWAEVDDELLRGLAEPHLKSIIGYALQQAIFEDIDEDTPLAVKDTVEKKVTVSQGEKNDQLEIGEFGMALLQNMTDGKEAQNFGFVSDDVDAPKKASKQHIDSILQLARKGTEKE